MVAVTVVHPESREEFHALLVTLVDVNLDRHRSSVHHRHHSLMMWTDVVGTDVVPPEHRHTLGKDLLDGGVDLAARVVADDVPEVFFRRGIAEAGGGVGGVGDVDESSRSSWLLRAQFHHRGLSSEGRSEEGEGSQLFCATSPARLPRRDIARPAHPCRSRRYRHRRAGYRYRGRHDVPCRYGSRTSGVRCNS